MHTIKKRLDTQAEKKLAPFENPLPRNWTTNNSHRCSNVAGKTVAGIDGSDISFVPH
jgi:hypothetical protein